MGYGVMTACILMTFGTNDKSYNNQGLIRLSCGEKIVIIYPVVILKFDVKLRVAFIFAFSIFTCNKKSSNEFCFVQEKLMLRSQSGSVSMNMDEVLIFLDEVQCEGHEKSLLDCVHSGWSNHDCSHTEGAGAICHNETGKFVRTMVLGLNLTHNFTTGVRILTARYTSDDIIFISTI